MALEHPGIDPAALLQGDDPPPVAIVNPEGASPFLLIGDHAGNRVPERLGRLGLAEAELARHIGWDIGIGALGGMLAQRLDAVFVAQTYSRLVVDCNRAAGAPDAIAQASDGTAVPGNIALTQAERAARFAAIHEPYQQAIATELARRDRAGRASVLVALHSFTPAMRTRPHDGARPWEIGVLHDRGDTAFALAVLARLRRDATWTVGDNEPYRMDSIDYTIPRHAYPARRYVELELRQDLIGDEAGQRAWAQTLAAVLRDALDSVRGVDSVGFEPT